MHSSLFVVLLIVLLALVLIGRCDVRRAAGQPPDVGAPALTDPSPSAADLTGPQANGPATPVVSSGPFQDQEGVNHGPQKVSPPNPYE